MKIFRALIVTTLCLIAVIPAMAEDPKLADYYPPPESKGGWRSLLPETGIPDANQKEQIRKQAGIDWDKLSQAWEFNASVEGATGLLVIRKGHVVGEWYKEGSRDKTFNIYSSSKAYTSVAYGLLLEDSEAGKLAEDKRLTLDTKVFTTNYLPEAFPLSDPRKVDITVRHLLNMTGGFGVEQPPEDGPYESILGKTEGSLFAKLRSDPGAAFNYSNAGVSHLVLLFNRVAGRELFPFMKDRVFDPVGMEQVSWLQIGGNGKLGPHDTGFSGVTTTPREHARFCYLALHRGSWAGKQVVPASYYDFAWKGIAVKPDYGAQWWVYPRHPQAPKDMVQTAGFKFNNGYVVPSLDLVIVRLGDGGKFPDKFEPDLLQKLLNAVEK